MQIIEHPTEFHIKIEFNRFKKRNENQIRKIDGSKFSWSQKSWIVPYSKKNELEEVQKLTNAEWIVLDYRPELVGAIPPMPNLDFELNIVNS